MKALVMAIGLAGIALADDVRLTIHMVAMEPAKLAELMEGAKEPSMDKAHAMVKAGEARLFDTMLLRMTREGEAKLISGGEQIFPVEMDPEDWPRTGIMEDSIVGQIGKRAPHMLAPEVWTSAFETKALGGSLSCRADKNGRTAWSLNHTRHVGETVHLEHQGMEGNNFSIRFPAFESLTMKGEMAPGGWICAGVLGIPGKDGSPGEKIVVFAKTTALVMEE